MDVLRDAVQMGTGPFAPPPEPRPKLQIRGLSKRYESKHGSTDALTGIDLDVYQNELICLIGESGCGKSTLLHIVAGFETSTAGTLEVDGGHIEGPDYRRSVVFQEPSLLPWLTVEKNVALGLEIRGVHDGSAGRVKALIDLMGLRGFERHYPAQMSGGMAQRVAIARALVNDPDLLLLDEPFGALDAFTRMRLQDELLRVWSRQQLTTVFVTHDIDEAVYLGSRVVVLTQRPGRIARIFNVGLRRPRDRTSPEFIRLSGMIAKEFLGLVRNDGGEHSPEA
ncbi:MAG TPA: ABC transporter ATP-binding protein [Longimicrobium sp.]|jgi:ABC-type nitrate/sulfonate/bicarbonate transport system ATPase subunit